MKRARTTATLAKKQVAPRPSQRDAEIVVPIEGGGSVSVQGKTALIRDEKGRILVRFSEGTALIAAPEGDLVLSAPRGKVVLQSAEEVAISAGEGAKAPQLRVEPDAVTVESERLDVRSGAARLVAEQAAVLADRITTTATTLSHTVERFELSAGQIVERARDAFRDVSELSQMRAGRVRTIVKDLYSVYSKRTALQSTEETSVDGSKVLLG